MPPSLLINKASLLLLFLLPGTFFIPKDFSPQNCDGIEVKLTIKNSSDLEKGSVEASVSGAVAPLYYIFYKPSGQLISNDLTSSKVQNVEPGTYFLSIKDGKGCIKKTEFKIE